MGLTLDREQDLMEADAIRTQDGESRWARDGYVVIGPTDDKPSWLPAMAEDDEGHGEGQHTILTVALSRPFDKAAVMAALEPLGVHLLDVTAPLD